MPHIEIVDIEKARSLILEMTEKIQGPEYQASLAQLEEDMKELIHGMILTAIFTGLIEDKPERLEELRSKLVVALDTGFILGKER
ncbi:unnamed protein product [marine sediment metagenome]|uniref:Uncharacterized protein n=1 Tax=marine sediment metagenome TaxID=412755 RepID=X1SKE8_9ZZZZ